MAGLTKKSILVVEDDFINAILFRKILEVEYEITHVPDGVAALEQVEKQAFDLILLDINLGRNSPDGTAVFKKIRENPATKNIPVIAITAYALDFDRERFISQGFDDYISKPVSKTFLLNSVRSILNA